MTHRAGVFALALVLCLLSFISGIPGISAKAAETAKDYTFTEVSANEIRSGEQYVFAIPGVVSGKGTGTYVLASGNAAQTHLRDYLAFDGKTATMDMIWTVEASENGYSLKAADSEKYLNIRKDEEGKLWLEMVEDPQALDLTAEGKRVVISRTIDGTKYRVRYTGNDGSGWQAAAAEATSQFVLYHAEKQISEPSGEPVEESISQGTFSDIVSGGMYIFAIPGINSENKGSGTFALASGDAVQNDKRDYLRFDEQSATTDMVWTAEAMEGGYSLKSAATGTYLNIVKDGDALKLCMGEAQALQLEADGDKVIISREIGGAKYRVRYTNSGEGGWQAAEWSAVNTSQFSVWIVGEAVSEPEVEQISPASIQVGETYVFAIDGITSSDQGSGTFALSSEPNENVDPQLREHVRFDKTTETLEKSIAWIVEQSEDGYALRSVQDGQYLNLVLRSGNGSLELGDKQTLQLTADGNNVVISREIDGANYRVRFTNNAGCGWQAATAESSSQFQVYHVTGEWPEEPDVPDTEPERDEPLVTIAAFTDFHVDYGMQNQEQTMRETNLEMFKTIKEKENPDIVLVGGDTISNNGGAPWDEATYQKVIGQLSDSLAGVSDTVLYVNGNHDYEVGGTAFNSGAFIDTEMQEKVGPYDDVLYESEDRKSNLLAYYYKLEGIHFIGLNTPYNGDKTVNGYVYTPESVEWVAGKLAEIGTDEPVIFLSHYMLQDSRGASEPGKGLTNANGMNDRLKEILLQYPNLIQLYGHDHGAPFIESDTFERITAYQKDGSVLDSRAARPSGFVSAFMGSLSYYNNRFNGGWLSAEQPKVVQALMIYVYEDHVELEMKNYGEEEGARRYPFTYSLSFVKTISSSVYAVEDDAVTDIPYETTVGEFIANLDHSDQIAVKDFDGSVITDPEQELRNGMTAERVIDGETTDEKKIWMNQAAVDPNPYQITEVTLKNAEGQAVNAMRMASELDSVSIQKNGHAQGGVLFAGVYAEDGSLLRQQTVPVTGTGRYTLGISLEDCPETATYRVFVMDSLDNAAPVSRLVTSNDEHYLLDTLSGDADSELVAGVDQRDNKVVVFRQNAEDWNSEDAVVWEWSPAKEDGFTGISYYKNASDAKLRYSDFYGGYVAITTSSGGFVGVIDYETGERIYSRDISPENNSHAIELLPDGNVAVASSTGNTVTVYAASQGDGNGYYRQYELRDAHGLLWDPDLEVLWALGGSQLVAFKVAGTQEEPELELQEDMVYTLPTEGGHDLYPVYGSPEELWVTTVSDVYHFNTDTREFTTDYAEHEAFEAVKNIKAVGNQPFSQTIVSITPNGTMESWNSNTIDLYHPVSSGYFHEQKVHTADAYYKARVWYGGYQ